MTILRRMTRTPNKLRMPALRLMIMLFAFIAVRGSVPVAAQEASYISVGNPTDAVLLPLEQGVVDVNSGDLHLEIPLGSHQQRGSKTESATLVYDSHMWTGVFNGTSTSWQPTNVPIAVGGWRLVDTASPGIVNYDYGQDPVPDCAGNYGTSWEGWTWTAPDGTFRQFGTGGTFQFPNDGCNETVSTYTAYALDSSGYYMSVVNFDQASIFAPDGSMVYPTVKDTNGNYFTTLSSGNVVDTLDRTVVTVTNDCNGNANEICYGVLNSQGTYSTYTVTTESISVDTAFGKEYWTEYSGSITVTKSIELPDGTTYEFTYDSGTSSGHYGLLTGMTLPTGGSVTYQHEIYLDPTGIPHPWLLNRTVGGGTWTYTPEFTGTCPNEPTCQQTVTVAKPSGDNIVYTSTASSGTWNGLTEYYQGAVSAANLLRTETTSWSNGPGAQKLSVTTTLPTPGGSVSSTKQFTYVNTAFPMISVYSEYQNYTGTLPSTPYRTTTTAYQTGYPNNDIDRPTSVMTKNGAGTLVAQTATIYDSYGNGITPITGVTQHDDTDFGASYTTRGNAVTIRKCFNTANCNFAGNYVATNLSYDTTGQVIQVEDPNLNVTSFSYANNFFTDGSSGPTAYSGAPKTNAYLTQMTYPSPLSWTSSAGFYWGDGKVAKTTDPNGQTTTFDYFDSFDRHTQTKFPNGRWFLDEYTSSTLYDSYQSITSSTPSSGCSSCIYTRLALDNLGRPETNTLESDPDGATSVVKTYDTNGRIQTVTNPYRSTSDPTYGLDTYSYDAVGRVVKISHTDGTSFSIYYGAAVTTAVGGITTQLCSTSTYGIGYPSLTVDEAGRKRETWTDGVGRTIEVDEPNSSGTLTLNTCYTYDYLDDLTGVTQGTQTRTYVYDGLSRLTQATTPESGIVKNSYKLGLHICSGDPREVCTKTDARGIVATYTYDAINRLTGITYSGGSPTTPSVAYTYDAGTNQNGFRTGMSDGSGSTTWTYNAVGWMLAEQRTIAGVPQTLSYSYNLDGSISSITYPSGRTVTYSVGNAERPLSAKDLTNNIQYAVTASYSPTGAWGGVIYGPATGFTGITQGLSYNNRLQNTAATATSTAGTAQNLSFNYTLPTGNDGTINSITNNVTSGLSESFTYDPMNRILSAATTSTSGSGCWGQGFGASGSPEDRWGNLTQISSTQCTSGMLSVTASSSTNQLAISGVTGPYDPSGNMVNDGNFTYTFDANNNLIQAAGTPSGTWNYAYDGNGFRVEKSNSSGGTLYWRLKSGETIAETDLTGSTTNSNYREYIFLAGHRIATRDAVTPNPNVFYFYFDQVGSTTGITSASGVPCYQATFTPYGQEMAILNSCQFNYKFTGYERDSETGLDYAFARFYNSRFARFMSADPLGGDLTNPQSLNGYAYVLNNSTSMRDPSGAGSIKPCTKNCFPYSGLGDPNKYGGMGICDHYNDWQPALCGALEGSNNCFADGAPIACQTLNAIGGDEFSWLELSGAISQRRTQWVDYTTIGFGFDCGKGCIGSETDTTEQVTYSSTSFIDSWQSLLGNLKKAPISVSVMYIFPIVGEVGVGPVGTVAYVPTSHTWCVGGGGAVGTADKSISGGPLLLGTAANPTAVLGGWSWGASAQAEEFLGVQGTWNSSGSYAGPTAGNVGASISRTWSKCR
jgi:RHS repeat-associated protein